ncbi:hypothetical protein [Lacihabitans soyangensis]|uniref:Uncharacterized protein n=1 Tax=Lacihabitans soyangensis TaxID=869394 RepID=A0AAE3H1G7_9BACT|nr:hypothetical protein [Lacihabitans soyangensis]MCP9762311.1 hypothetical protein [Lacihabitans soyangensis]
MNFYYSDKERHVMFAYMALRAYGFGYLKKWSGTEFTLFFDHCISEKNSPYGKSLKSTENKFNGSIQNYHLPVKHKLLEVSGQKAFNFKQTFESFGKKYSEIKITQDRVEITEQNFEKILDEQLERFGHFKYDPTNNFGEGTNEFPIVIINYILKNSNINYQLDEATQSSDQTLNYLNTKEYDITHSTGSHLLSKKLCEILEFKSNHIQVKVVTSDLLWAKYFIEQIIEATFNDNTFLYLLMGEETKPMRDFLGKIGERNQMDKIQVCFANNDFPNPHDYVIYDNISDSLSAELEIEHLVGSHGKGQNNFLGIQGISHFKHETKGIETDVVLISPEKTELLLHWFDRTFKEKNHEQK